MSDDWLTPLEAGVDAAYLDLLARVEDAGILAAPPGFEVLWGWFREWFGVPVAGIEPAGDMHSFGVGFIDGDPERESLEITPPEGLTPPLVELSLVRDFSVPDPELAAASIGLGTVGFVAWLPLDDAWRTLPASDWENSNPLGWVNGGSAANRREALSFTEATKPFELASRSQPLRVELFSRTRPDAVVLGG